MAGKDLDVTRQTEPYNPFPQPDLKALAEPFDPKEVDFRLGQAGVRDGKPWAKVLAYIDARAVMDRLDEVVGPGNWKDRYWREGAGEMCGLSIKVNNEWVEKVDGSEDTDIEAFKGGISKALVRAAVKWGVGRYLYNLGDGWAKIVPSGTAGSKWQPEKRGDKPCPAFNWLPPELPEWALPKRKPPVGGGQAGGGNGTAGGGGGPARPASAALPGNPAPGQGAQGSAPIAARTAQTQAGMREKLNGGNTNAAAANKQTPVPAPGQAAPGAAQAGAQENPKFSAEVQPLTDYEREAQEFFAGAGVFDSPAGAERGPAEGVRAPDAPAPAGGAPATGRNAAMAEGARAAPGTAAPRAGAAPGLPVAGRGVGGGQAQAGHLAAQEPRTPDAGRNPGPGSGGAPSAGAGGGTTKPANVPAASPRRGAAKPPGAGPTPKPVSPASGGKSAPGAGKRSAPIPRANPGAASGPAGPGSDAPAPGQPPANQQAAPGNGSDPQPEQAGGNGAQLPGGSGAPALQGSGGPTGSPAGGTPEPKVIPKSQEEIEWFGNYIQTALTEVKTFEELSTLWTANASSIKALPEALKNIVVALKNEVKAKVMPTR